MVVPFVVILPGDFPRLQHGSGLLPGTEHLMQPGGVLALPHNNLQADLSIRLADIQPVVVLRGTPDVHDPYIVIYGRDRRAMGEENG